MSARKLELSSGLSRSEPFKHSFAEPLCLPAEAVRVRRSGIEFHYPRAVAPWTEAVVRVCPAGGGAPLTCTGVVVACVGSPRAGYHVSMVLIGLAPRIQRQLAAIAHSQLS